MNMCIDTYLEGVNLDQARFEAYNFIRKNFVPSWRNFSTVEEFIQIQDALQFDDLRFVNVKGLIFDEEENKTNGVILSLRCEYDFVKIKYDKIVDYYRKTPFLFDGACCGGTNNDDLLSNLQNQIAMIGYDVDSLHKITTLNFLKDGKFVVNSIEHNDLIGIKTPIRIKDTPEKLKKLLKELKQCTGSCGGCSSDCEGIFELYRYRNEIQFNPVVLDAA
jgi:hypothetical protein